MGSAGTQKGRESLNLPCKAFTWLRLLYQKLKNEPPIEGALHRRNKKESREIKRREVVQVNMKVKTFGDLGHLLRRGAAAVLVMAMTLSMIPVYSWADELLVPPAQVTDQNDFPKIEFQTNFVRTEYGTLTGLMELSIRVGPSGTKADGSTPDPVSFQSVSATLQFNNKLFKPISWRWAFNEDGTAQKEDIALSNKNYYDVKIAAKKDDSLPGTGAIAQCGILEESAANARTMSANVASGEQSLLFFKAESYGAKIDLAEMTTLAVVRFYVDPALMEHITIQKEKGVTEPDGTPKYQVLFDGDKTNPVTIRDQLNNLISNSMTGTTSSLAALGLASDFTAVDFAVDGDTVKSKSPANMALDYTTGDNEFYFVPGYTKDDPNTVESVTYTPKNTSTIYTLDAPKTLGSKVLAVDSTAADGAANKYSYTSNLIPSGNIAFTVCSQMSFADNGDGRENMATVLFYDWDNTLIGVLVVPRKDDARALVNDYVRNNMIHPDLRYSEVVIPGEVTSTDQKFITSLMREYSYRGKYPCNPMGENDADSTMDEHRPDDDYIGSDYPLTNKLDYVFLKRPMEKVEGAVDAEGNPTNTWKQLGDDTQAEWDKEYPYIHGWALIPDDDLTDIQYTHPENIWTTIGVGELTNYTGLSFGAYASPADIASGAVRLISETEDFSVADFDFSQKDHSLGKGSVYAVKAIYEPGESLRDVTNMYRMVSEPYYNKLNLVNASSGGAYSVDITFGRASADTGFVQGVARIREPDVRQDTTSDIRWEDEYLNNATVAEEQSKNKTAYTKVVVDNGEEVEIQLVLSARQNKIDYYIIDSYNYSFVTGGARSVSNAGYADSAHVIDNFNYKTETSDVSIDGVDTKYYDAPYEDREGSYGFVLYGTVNNLGQKLTEDYNGKLSLTDFNTTLSVDNMNDINLRSYNNEKPSGRTLENFRNALKAAVAEAVRLHDTGDNRAWDVEHGYAQFTYHQLQLYVSEYLDPNATPTLRTASAADAIAINWCHLHEECAALALGKPRNWDELIKTAQRTDLDQEGKIDAIRLLTLAELETMAHIRVDANGAAFPDNRAFAIAFIEAVEEGNTAWDTIQDYIIRKDQADGSGTYARENYWWYDGSTRISFGSLLDTVAAVQDVIKPKLAPGETTAVVRNAKINQLKPVYEEDYSSGAVTTAWNNATKNLSITKGTDEGQKFDSWEDFRDKFVTAVRGAENNNVKLEYDEDDDGDTRAKKLREYWNKLQYSILHGGTYVANPDAAQQAEMDAYWWYDGAVQVNNLATLIRAAQDANSGKPASMNMFTFEALYKLENAELHFARNFQGEKYVDAADADTTTNDHLVFSEFKEDIMAYVQEDRTFLRNNAPDWNRVQYYLIHGQIQESYIGLESSYYWWKEGKAALPVDFTLGGAANDGDPVARADALAVALMDAAFRATYNGNTVAWDDLTTTVLERGRLVASSSGGEATFPDDFTMVGDLAAFETEIVALMQQIGGTNPTFPSPSATWHQVQYYLMENSYVSNAGWLETNTNYWWKAKDSNGVSPVQLFRDLSAYVERIAGGDASAADELRAWYDDEKAEKLEFTLDGAELVTSDIWGEVPWEDFDYSVCGDPFALTWAQVELIFAYYAAAEEWYFTDNDESTSLLEDELGIPATPPSGTWVPMTARSYAMRRAPGEPNIQSMINNLSARITLLSKSIQKDPTKVDEYAEKLEQLLIEMEELKALLGSYMEIQEPAESLVPSETPEVMESPDFTESPEVTESPVPSEIPEMTETPIPSKTPEETEAPEETETPEPTEAPEPSETPEVTETETPAPGQTDSPEEQLPEPSVPGVETPEVTASPEPTESAEPSVPVEPPETEAPEETPAVTASPEPEYTLETMPEVVAPEPEENIEETDLPETVRTVLPVGPPEPETTVVETNPPLSGSLNLRNRSTTMDYKKMTTKIATTKLRISAGGMRMRQWNFKDHIGPPGQPWSVPLLLRSESKERRRTV